jgi:hypothetical protein
VFISLTRSINFSQLLTTSIDPLLPLRSKARSYATPVIRRHVIARKPSFAWPSVQAASMLWTCVSWNTGTRSRLQYTRQAPGSADGSSDCGGTKALDEGDRACNEPTVAMRLGGESPDLVSLNIPYSFSGTRAKRPIASRSKHTGSIDAPVRVNPLVVLLGDHHQHYDLLLLSDCTCFHS